MAALRVVNGCCLKTWAPSSSVPKLRVLHSRPSSLRSTSVTPSLARGVLSPKSGYGFLVTRALSSQVRGSNPERHEVTFKSDAELNELQTNLFSFLQQSSGLQGGRENGQAGGQETWSTERKIARVSKTSGDTEASWPLEWCTVEAPSTKGLAIGSAPRSGAEMSKLLETGEFDAVVLAMHPKEVLALGINVEELGKAVDNVDRVFMQCPVTDGTPSGLRDDSDLGAVEVDKLKEALRVVTALVRTGQRTLICCTNGTTSSALLALCYLTFLEGMSLREAMATLKFSVPGARPSLRSWDEARSAWSTLENSTRLKDLAETAANGRASSGSLGSAMDDWMAARQQLIIEMLNEQAAGDVALAKAVGKVGKRDADSRVVSKQAVGSSQEAVPAVFRDFMQQSMQDAAFVAERETETARRELEMNKAETKRLASELAAAERQLAESQLAKWKVQKEEPANEIQTFLAQSALEAALRKETETRELIEKLEVELRATSRSKVTASERLEFLEREAERLREKEAASRKVSQEAVKQAKQLSERLERTEASRAAAADKAEELVAEVVLLREQNQKAVQSEAELLQLKGQVDTLSADLVAAQEAAALARDRSEFLMRHVSTLREKIESGQVIKDRAAAAQKVEQGSSAAVIAQLQAELQETKERAVKAEMERDAALEQVTVLKVQLEEAEKKMQEAARKLLEAEDKIGFLLRQVESTKGKRRAAEGALAMAKEQVKRMARNVDTMRLRIFQSTTKSNSAAEAAEAVISTAEDLYTRLEQHAKNLQTSISLTDETTAQLEQRQKGVPAAKVTALADAVPGILASAEANAKGKSLSPNEEQLLQDVTCLREAVEVLDGSHTDEAPKSPPAVGLFDDLVKGGPTRTADPVGVPIKRSGLQT